MYWQTRYCSTPPNHCCFWKFVFLPSQKPAEYLTVSKRSRKSYQNGPGRSKLAPHVEQIRAWQAKGSCGGNKKLILMIFPLTNQNLCGILRRSFVQ